MANSNLVTREDLKNVFEALGEGSYGTRIDVLESHDYIVEQGTSGAWTYRKWASGIAECWCSIRTSSLTWTAYMASPSANPYLYYSAGWNFYLPFTFADTSYVVNANALEVGPNFGWVARGSKTDSSFTLYIVRNGNTGSVSMDVMVKGRWK